MQSVQGSMGKEFVHSWKGIANVARILRRLVAKKEIKAKESIGYGYLRSSDVPGNIVCKESARLRRTEEPNHGLCIPTYLHRCSRSYECMYTCNAAVEARSRVCLNKIPANVLLSIHHTMLACDPSRIHALDHDGFSWKSSPSYMISHTLTNDLEKKIYDPKKKMFHVLHQKQNINFFIYTISKYYSRVLVLA